MEKSLLKQFKVAFCIFICLGNFWCLRPLSAQFLGNFDIERHFLDLENFLDWKAYQPSLDWKYEWREAETGLLASVGSINFYDFYYLNELKFGHALGKYAHFYYQQVEESFYSKEPIYQEIEFRFGRQLGLSVIGNAPHDKKHGHQGYSLSYGYRNSLNFVRLSTLDQYFLYNEKNANTDKNVKDERYLKVPTFNRVESQFFWNKQLFIELDLGQVSEAEFESDDPAMVSSFSSQKGDFTIDWHSKNNWLLGLSGFYNRENRDQNPVVVSQALPDLEQLLMLQWLDIYYVLKYNESNELSFGAIHSEFLNEINSSVEDAVYKSKLDTSQIYGFWQLRRSDWFHWRFSLQAGRAYIFRDYIGIEEKLDEENMEMKAGVGILMQEVENYRLFINTTWDLDIFTTRQWDGGNVQLQMVF